MALPPRPAAGSPAAVRRVRMTGTQRREQLIQISRALFAERGYEATSIEEIAQRAQVSKPVVYEHFGGKEGLYAVVVDREMAKLNKAITSSLSTNRALARNSSRLRLERVTLALLTYVEESTDGFRILVRDSPVAAAEGTYSSLLNEAIGQVEYLLGHDFERRGFDPALAALYAQALVGVVSTSATWWLDVRTPAKEEMASHLVNLCWNGLLHLDAEPTLDPRTLEFGSTLKVQGGEEEDED
ncbi:TetR/AcrR family transcriptional regulator [Tomitella biformata]|uniref:TetR/AcrR family transcriptional regulator n=1 Tax=Tomitella biformata TaxID=630403 RepID=UPI000687E758|nr:TetR/AcrR family transcriptional regulator [Tomitella biformata]